jgi:acetate kinase
MTRHVLALNCGSSSLKYAFFEVDDQRMRALVRDEVPGVGDKVPDHAAAVHAALDDLARLRLPAPDAIGHRIVHGGCDHVKPERIDDALMASLRTLIPFAPLHLPAELSAVGAARARFPGSPQVACFDTAFHRTMPEAAQRFALPAHFFDEGVLRYGFHGLSYEYVVDSVGAQTLGRAVLAHLGNGASMCAVREGRSVDTTMGFTPAAGLVMGTRAGDIDPGLVTYLLQHGCDGASFDRLVNHEAGLLALSGTTADMKRLVEARDRDARAALAIDVFCLHARKAIGALATTLGGIDSLVFTGGIGEHAPFVRKEIARGLEHLGVRIDDGENEANAAVIGSGEGGVAVRVVPTDEEHQVARHAARLIERAAR